MITPGLFVRVRMPFEHKPEDALLVPDRALGSDQGGAYLLVVGAGRQGGATQRSAPGPSWGPTAWWKVEIGPDDRVDRRGAAPRPPRPEGQPQGRGRRPGPRRRRRRPLTPRNDRRPTGSNHPPRKPTAMFSKFFIDRPIFANVIAIMTILVGAVTILVFLPVEQYPADHPADRPGDDDVSLGPTRRSCPTSSPRRSSRRSTASRGCSTCPRPAPATASYTLTVTFEVGTDLDKAQVLVQNRVAIAQPRLPQEVQRQGITTKKQSTAIILVVGPDLALGQVYDSLYLSNYATLYIKDAEPDQRRRRHPGLRLGQLRDAGLARPGEAQGPRT